MIPEAKVEIRFDGSTWVNVSSPTNYVKLAAGLNITRGRDDESGDAINPGTFSFTLENNDGRVSPGLTTSPYYPYVVEGVAVRVSMLVDGSYRPRAYGTVQSWSVSWLGGSAGSSVCVVTCTDTLGAFPSYTLRQPADEVVRALSETVAHWPLRDSEGPISSLIGPATIAVNEPTVGGLGAGSNPLAMEDGADKHPSFTSGAGGLQLTATGIPVSMTASQWRVRFILFSAPTEECTLLRFSGPSGPLDFAWSTTLGFTCALMTTSGLPASYPIVVELGNPGGSTLYTRWADASGTVTSVNTPTGYVYYAPNKITVNPVLSGGAVWSIAHLVEMTGIPDSTALGNFAKAILGSRIPESVAVASQLSTWAGGPTITGATVGECVIPPLEGRDAADAIGALVTGMGARLVDDLAGGLTWVPFAPDSTPVALPSGEIDPGLVWETSNVGWCTDATVTRYDGQTYTATRAGGKPQSVAIEGVHATWSKDRSYADWLVNTSNTDPRLSSASYELLSLDEADAASLCGITVGSRVTITDLPTQVPAGTLTAIVEGIEDSISDVAWMLTLKLSPDVYSRLFILDDPVQGVLDAGYLLAP